MDELVDRIVANVGVERSVAERAVAIILHFLATEGPTDKVEHLIAGLPGAAEAIDIARTESGPLFGMSGIMGVGSRLMGVGLGMGEIKVSRSRSCPMRAKKLGMRRSMRSSPQYPALPSSFDATAGRRGSIMTIPISDLSAVDPALRDKLKGIGIRTTGRLLETAKRANDRKVLAKRIEIDPKILLASQTLPTVCASEASGRTMRNCSKQRASIR